jgi:hypothetical protein
MEEYKMNNPNNNIWGSWKIQNLDEAHFYQMGSWTEQKQKSPRLFMRIWEAVNDRLIAIRCRLETFITPAYSAVDQQCSCA